MAPRADHRPHPDRAPYLDVALRLARAAGRRRPAPSCSSSTTARRGDPRRSPRATARATSPTTRSRGLNAARNTRQTRPPPAAARASSTTTSRCGPGWLAALLAADAEAAAERRRAHRPDPRPLRGPPPARLRSRGPPITSLDLGPADRDAEHAWGANMAVRRAALERAGPLRRGARALRRRAGVAGAAAGRRRAHPLRRGRRRSTTAAPATTRGCARSPRAAYGAGRRSRRFDVFKGARRRWAPSCACSPAALLHVAALRAARTGSC